MREKIEGLVKAVRQSFEDGSTISLAEIYEEVKKKVDLTSEQEEITYGQPNFQHSVRRTLSTLVEKGEIIRVGKGKYRKRSQNIQG